MDFQSWLGTQQLRKDGIGKFARDLSKLDLDQFIHSRGADEHKKWANVITRQGTWFHITTFNRAWSEFQTAQENQVHADPNGR